MARHLIPGDKAIRSALRVPDQQIKDARDAKAAGLPVTVPKMTRILDGDGLYLLSCVKGVSHAWRFDYVFRGVAKTLSLGKYPAVGLADARSVAADFRALIAKGINPSDERKAEKERVRHEMLVEQLLAAGKPLPGSFEDVARRWSKEKHALEVSEGHVATTLLRLEQDVFPWLGARPIGSIEAPDVLECLRRVQERGALETAHRIKGACGQVFRFAIGEGKWNCGRDPTADLRDAMPQPVASVHAAITDPRQLARLLVDIHRYSGTLVVRVALKLSPLLFQRPGEIRFMEWQQIDLDAAMWTVPAAAMKRRLEGKRHGAVHLVPLSRQAVELLKELQPVSGKGSHVFPGLRGDSRPISESTLSAALKALGYPGEVMTAHGFRATARTILAEVLEEEDGLIDAQLAHTVRDANGKSYNRTTWVNQRRLMMQKWADYLDDLRLKQGQTERASPAV